MCLDKGVLVAFGNVAHESKERPEGKVAGSKRAVSSKTRDSMEVPSLALETQGIIPLRLLVSTSESSSPSEPSLLLDIGKMGRW